LLKLFKEEMLKNDKRKLCNIIGNHSSSMNDKRKIIEDEVIAEQAIIAAR
jgi:hypothetical protein